MNATLTFFFQGSSAMGFLVSALFFVRFHRRTGDRLFSFFACAFLIMALERCALAFLVPVESNSLIYSMRLIAFVIIAWGIVDKNRQPHLRQAS